jgi:hypothetical protein
MAFTVASVKSYSGLTKNTQDKTAVTDRIGLKNIVDRVQ